VRSVAAAGLAAAALCLLPASAAAAESCAGQSAAIKKSNRAQVERALLCLVNVHRIDNGVAPVSLDTRLARAARKHSAQMVKRGFFSHFDKKLGGPSKRAGAAGYTGGVGENIAVWHVRPNALTLFNRWRTSSGHNDNMLSKQWTGAGMGVKKGMPSVGGKYGITGTQMFGAEPPDTTDTALDLCSGGPACVPPPAP
jgi:uncharacterized protein YkwD